MKEIVPPTFWGPAMNALSRRRQVFVMTMWECAPISAAEAARKAGYSQDLNSSAVQAHRLMHTPEVRAAMIEYGQRCMSVAAPEIHHILMKIARAEQHKDQAKVALALFTRAGFHDVVGKTLNVNVTITKQEKIAQLREMMAAEGKTPEQIAAVFGSLTDYEVEGTARDVTGTAEEPYRDEEY